MKRLAVSSCAAFLMLASCEPKHAHAAAANDFSTCPAAKRAMDVLDHFLAAFNAKDMPALEKTFHFPHMRVASYPLSVLAGPGQQDDVFGIWRKRAGRAHAGTRATSSSAARTRPTSPPPSPASTPTAWSTQSSMVST